MFNKKVKVKAGSAYKLMQFCKIAYHSKRKIRKYIESFGSRGGIYETNEDLMYWFIGDNWTLYFVFSGTRNIPAWAKNLKFGKSSLPDGKTIHQGFYDPWANKFKEYVIKVLLGYSVNGNRDNIEMVSLIDKICCVGHSRGAAIALLAARDMVKNRGISRSKVSSVVFGAPRVGNMQFVEEMGALKIKATSYSNGYDPVSDLPPTYFGYIHTPSLWGKHYKWLKQPRWHRLPIIRWFDHSQKSYLKALKKY